MICCLRFAIFALSLHWLVVVPVVVVAADAATVADDGLDEKDVQDEPNEDERRSDPVVTDSESDQR